MRLLNVKTNQLQQVFDASRTRYAILSHTWETNEPTYQDFCADAKAVLCTPKVQGLLDLAKNESRAVPYVWIDTICIDKTSSAELQEAINSMYKWYQNAAICYAHLKDVDQEEQNNEDNKPNNGTDEQMTGTPPVVSGVTAFDHAILNSRWFKRGWTLQELLAPRLIYFHNANWKRIGIKLMIDRQRAPPKLGARDFVPLIHEATGIPVGVLEGRERMQSYSVGQRMSWASKRKTTREEDLAYCLMGLFGVNMPMLYGEGHAAFRRLQDEIMKRTDDHSLLAYNYHRTPTFMATDYNNNLDPLTPNDYGGCAHVVRLRSFTLYNSPDPLPRAHDGSFSRGKGSACALGGMNPGPSTPRQQQLLSPPPPSSSPLSSQWTPGQASSRRSGGSGSFGNMTSLGNSLDDLRGSNSGLVFNNTMEHYVMTNKGLHIELDTLAVPKLPGMLVGRLNCIVKDEATRGRPEDRVVVLPLYQLPTLPGSKVVLRTLGASLVDLPLWLFDARTTTTRPLYITNNPYDAEMHRGSTSLLEFVSRKHPFIVAEMYPPVLDFSHFQGDFRNLEGWPMRFSYAAEDLPRRIYVRLRSEWRNISFLVKLKLEYDAWHEPSRAECSVAAMPPDKSLLELLLLDEYPAPHGPIQTIASSYEYTKDRIEYTQTLQYRSNVVVKVQVALLRGNCIRLTVTTDVSGAVHVAADEYEQLVEARAYDDIMISTT